MKNQIPEMKENEVIFSIIIPVYNDLSSLQGLIPLLEKQSIDRHLYEVIVIDNCSGESITDVLNGDEKVLFLKECTHLNSPYSSRNRGIEHSKGEIIVLLDSTCYPEPDWLEQAQLFFEKEKPDLVAGAVEFRFHGDKPTTGEFYDSLTNIKMKEAVEERNVAKTANLFVKRSVFDQIGKFEEGLRSGGDVAWTQKATENGYSLKFCDRVIVKKEARKLFQLFKKQYRVGKGQPKIWRKQGTNKSLIKTLLSTFKPISYKKFTKTYKEACQKNDISILRLFIVASFVRIIMRTANTIALIKS